MLTREASLGLRPKRGSGTATRRMSVRPAKKLSGTRQGPAVMSESTTVNESPVPTFVDLFAGCGGLSLGLLLGGWRGLLAVERDPMAFDTYRHNLISGRRDLSYSWPEWLPQQPYDIRSLLESHGDRFREWRGKVDLVAGGPPCQGFSFAGKRRSADPRNRLFRDYLRFVNLVQPRLVLFENVGGMAVSHGKKHKPNSRRRPYTEKVLRGLRDLGYHVLDPVVLRASDCGVPQRRPRVFILAVRADPAKLQRIPSLDAVVHELRDGFLKGKGLRTGRHTTVEEAISDLEKRRGRTYRESFYRTPQGFLHGTLGRRKGAYQRLMRGGHRKGFKVDSHRFANHSLEIQVRFELILQTSRRGVQLSAAERCGIYTTAKHVIVALSRHHVAHTITTLPDDLIHYSEPRILTVREMARLQSFPDWFEFRGKFTTGGPERVRQAPRYTQVGNAVAPLVAELLTLALERYLGLEMAEPAATPLPSHGVADAA